MWRRIFFASRQSVGKYTVTVRRHKRAPPATPPTPWFGGLGKSHVLASMGRGLSLAGLALLFAGSLWLVHRLEGEQPQFYVERGEQPDHTMETFTTVRIDDHGQMINRLQAGELRHYPRRDTELTRPDLVFYTAGQPQWHLHSENGRVSRNEDVVWFMGKAVFRHHTDDSQIDLEVFSRDVRVEPGRGYAETKAYTILYGRQGKMEGTGLRFRAQEQQMDLLADVRGRHESLQ